MSETACTPQPHDSLFRAAMSDLRVARDVLQAYLPPSALRHLDLSTLRLEHGNSVDSALQSLSVDMLYSVRKPGTEPDASPTAYVYVLVEHQSTPHPMMRPLHKSIFRNDLEGVSARKAGMY